MHRIVLVLVLRANMRSDLDKSLFTLFRLINTIQKSHSDKNYKLNVLVIVFLMTTSRKKSIGIVEK